MDVGVWPRFRFRSPSPSHRKFIERNAAAVAATAATAAAAGDGGAVCYGRDYSKKVIGW